jgi:hypothetical protein
MPIMRLDKLLATQTTGTLGKIIQRARNMDDLATRLRAQLPADTAESLLAANVREDGELVVLARSSAWASKLRFEGEKLMLAARSDGTPVSSFRVGVKRADGQA